MTKDPKGQAWIDREWTWELVTERLQRILAGQTA